MKYIPVDTVLGLILPYIPDDGKEYEIMDVLDDVENSEDIIDIEDIKAEIKGIIEEYDARCERWKPSRYKPTKGIAESNVAPRSPKEIESNKWGERAEGLERALKIIDKHINGKESEEQA